MFALVFIISFLLHALSLVCSFSSVLKWNFRLLTWDLSFFSGNCLASWICRLVLLIKFGRFSAITFFKYCFWWEICCNPYLHSSVCIHWLLLWLSLFFTDVEKLDYDVHLWSFLHFFVCLGFILSFLDLWRIVFVAMGKFSNIIYLNIFLSQCIFSFSDFSYTYCPAPEVVLQFTYALSIFMFIFFSLSIVSFG